mmetsp:Transcript_13355/g.40393  ORF Transcript_13355/g.40393 Transcript_13355/m.40393 type:complete len:234 (+) Transcript_13355:2482-3183(+)
MSWQPSWPSLGAPLLRKPLTTLLQLLSRRRRGGAWCRGLRPSARGTTRPPAMQPWCPATPPPASQPQFLQVRIRAAVPRQPGRRVHPPPLLPSELASTSRMRRPWWPAPSPTLWRGARRQRRRRRRRTTRGTRRLWPRCWPWWRAWRRSCTPPRPPATRPRSRRTPPAATPRMHGWSWILPLWSCRRRPSWWTAFTISCWASTTPSPFSMPSWRARRGPWPPCEPRLRRGTNK